MDEMHASLLRRAADRLEQMSEAEVLALGPIGALISPQRDAVVNQLRDDADDWEDDEQPVQEWRPCALMARAILGETGDQ